MEYFSTKSLDLVLKRLNVAWAEYNKDKTNDFVG